MEQTIPRTNSSVPKWTFVISIAITVLHAASHVSWIWLYNVKSELSHVERQALFTEFWIVPEWIGGRWFTGILLLLSLAAAIILGRRVDQKKGALSVVLLVLNILLILMAGWSLL